MACFLHYAWPGNVRELENVIERLCIIVEDDILLPEHLPEELWSSGGPSEERRTGILGQRERRTTEAPAQDCLRLFAAGEGGFPVALFARYSFPRMGHSPGLGRGGAGIICPGFTTIRKHLRHRKTSSGEPTHGGAEVETVRPFGREGIGFSIKLYTWDSAQELKAHDMEPKRRL